MNPLLRREELLRRLARLPQGRLERLLDMATERTGHCDICDAAVLEAVEVCEDCLEEIAEADRADIANDAARLRGES